MKTIVITGGSGFLGHHVIKRLAHDSIYNIICLDLYEAPFLKEYGVTFVKGNFSERHLLDELFANADYVFHMACSMFPAESNKEPYWDAVSNIGGSVQLLECAVKNNVKQVVFMSSGGTVYGIPQYIPIREDHPTNPECSYGIGKLAVEKYLRFFSSQYGIATCAIRLANPYGEYQNPNSNQGAVAVFTKRIMNHEKITIWGDGQCRRDFIYADDFADAFCKIIGKTDFSGELNIGSGKSHSLLEIIHIIEDCLKIKAQIEFLPLRKFDIPVSALDISKAKQLLQWEPTTDLFQGINKIIDYYQILSLQRTYYEPNGTTKKLVIT